MQGTRVPGSPWPITPLTIVLRFHAPLRALVLINVIFFFFFFPPPPPPAPAPALELSPFPRDKACACAIISSSLSRSFSHPWSQPSSASCSCVGACTAGLDPGIAVVPQTVRGALGLVDGEASDAKAEPWRWAYGGDDEASSTSTASTDPETSPGTKGWKSSAVKRVLEMLFLLRRACA